MDSLFCVGHPEFTSLSLALLVFHSCLWRLDHLCFTGTIICLGISFLDLLIDVFCYLHCYPNSSALWLLISSTWYSLGWLWGTGELLEMSCCLIFLYFIYLFVFCADLYVDYHGSFAGSFKASLANIYFLVLSSGQGYVLAFVCVPGFNYLCLFGRGGCRLFCPVPSSLGTGCSIVYKSQEIQVLACRESQLTAQLWHFAYSNKNQQQ